MLYNLIKTQKALSLTQISLGEYVLNPYRGCAFGCKYCYAQENKNMTKRKKDWGKFLDIKINLIQVLEKELKNLKPKRVILGSTTECFQPAEKEFRVTQHSLKLLKENNIPLTILTKSSLIKDYIDCINYHPQNKVYFSLVFSQKKIKNILEEKTPSLKERVETIEALIKSKIKVKIHIGPFIPFLENLKEIFQIIPPQIEEVEIELYNAKMGNFKEIVEIIGENLSKDIADRLKEVYSREENYLNFSHYLIEEAKNLNKEYNFKLNFIVPQFNFWYTNKIIYEP